MPNQVRNTFALRLKQLRSSYGGKLNQTLSQGEFAALLGIERDRYGSYERADQEPPLEILVRLRELTGVSLDHLIDRIDYDPNNLADA